MNRIFRIHARKNNLTILVVLLGALIFLNVRAAAEVKIGLEEGVMYGMENFFLENDYLKVVINPNNGARIIKLINRKDGKNYCSEEGAYHGAGKQYLSDEPDELTEAVWTMKIIKRDPEEAALKAVYKGKGVKSSGLTFEKIFRLKKGESLLHINYKIRSGFFAKNQVKMRIHNEVRPGSDPSVVNNIEKLSSFIPISAGPRQTSVNKVYYPRECWDGWAVIMKKDTSEGILSLFDISKTWRCFTWSAPTVEWEYGPIDFSPNSEFRDDTGLAPVIGLKSVDYADWDGAFEVELEKTELKIKAWGLKETDLKIVPILLSADNDKVIFTGESKKISLKPAAITELKWPVKLQPGKNIITKVVLTSKNGKKEFLANPQVQKILKLKFLNINQLLFRKRKLKR